MFIDGSKFHKQFLKRVTQGTFLWNYFKIWPVVSEKKIFWEFLHIRIAQEAAIHQSHVNGRIKISLPLFEKGQPRNIPVKLFQNRTSGFREEDFFRISSCPYSARSPINQSHVFGRIKISRTIFEKRHPSNIPLKLFRQWFHRRRFFKELLKKFNFIAMATTVLDRIKVCVQFLKRTSQRTFLLSLVQIGPVVWEKMF